MDASGPRRMFPIIGGRTAPGSYLAVGCLLALLKLSLDQFVERWWFGRPPRFLAASGFPGDLLRLLSGEGEGEGGDRVFYATMLALTAPFLTVALVMTVRRLRDAAWPPWLAAFTFAPTPLNIVFFLVLSQIPSRDRAMPGGLYDADLDGPLGPKRARPERAGIGDGAPRTVAAIVAPLAVGGSAAYLGTHVLRDYGLSLFLGLPFVLPMFAVVIDGWGRGSTPGRALQIGWACALAAVALMLALAFEGIICILMLVPLALPIVSLGALVGYFIAEYGPRRPAEQGKLAILLCALMPTMVGAEHLAAPEPWAFTCETSIGVDAPPEAVWRRVVSFSDLDPPDDWVFRTGLAYPIRARIEGSGVGAIRRCEFSTGTFVEPILAWDEPRLLRFAVTSNPPPMREWSPLFEAHPPHLDGFLVSERGQFELTPRPGGGTFLKGSTLYRHGLWPAAYWRLWSDPIIHRIHDRVLRHIKRLAESDAADPPYPAHKRPDRVHPHPGERHPSAAASGPSPWREASGASVRPLRRRRPRSQTNLASRSTLTNTGASRTRVHPSNPVGWNFMPWDRQNMQGERGQPRQNIAFVKGSNSAGGLTPPITSCHPDGRRFAHSKTPVSRARKTAVAGWTGRRHRATATRTAMADDMTRASAMCTSAR
ncbi:SRPBCC family protein [Paludisphaera soli]|uniref:SRPBCC family protein n=1 Tax=Paludisphaera soli TaxID=2712865 RepID=UPI0013EAD26C|nr:SRPBCC family protein [Paludisphaera soli]